ncbi:MAG: ABC transporter ATP-binding protein [Acidimicrobiia bacterium]|nr:ABC transporter ATP-binding protein [Acidimicrobiia bacterium]
METVLRFASVSKSYTRGQETIHALDSAELEVRSGDFVAVTGPSGSGKTTMLLVGSGIEQPTQGQVYYRDRPIDAFGKTERKTFLSQDVGFAMQHAHLWPGVSALNNVSAALQFAGFHPREADELAADALVAVGLGDRIQHVDSELSGGQQQRVALARAMAKKPLLLFADEPTGNLDSEASRRILQLIRDLTEAAGTAVLLVTHDPAALDYATRHIVIRDGKLLESAPGDGS